MLSVVNGGLAPVPWEDLDPALVQEIQRESSGYTLDVLKSQLSPRDAVETTPGGDEYVVSDTVAPNSPCHVPNPDLVLECGLPELPSSIHSDDETEHDAFFVQKCVEEVENAEWVLHHSGAHHTPFLQVPKWPQYRLFHQYLTQTTRAAGHTLPGSKDMQAAYREFKQQHPRPIPVTPPYTPTGWKHEPVHPVMGPVPPLTLQLGPNEGKPSQTTVINHGAKRRIRKRHMTARDLPRVPHDSQSMPRTCWACDPEAPTTAWPVLHLIARHTHTPQPTYHHRPTHG